jgi:hypothetical protein
MKMRTSLFLILMLIIATPSVAQTKKNPELNQKIVEYLETVIGKTVDRGECWDLANQALSTSGAYFDRSSQRTIYIFGKEVNPEKEAIYPGDIIQFTNVKLQYEKDNVIYTETMAHHTAIVYKVYDKGHYELAHQNTGFSGKKVGLSDLRIKDVKNGKMKFYRPFRK